MSLDPAYEGMCRYIDGTTRGTSGHPRFAHLSRTVRKTYCRSWYSNYNAYVPECNRKKGWHATAELAFHRRRMLRGAAAKTQFLAARLCMCALNTSIYGYK